MSNQSKVLFKVPAQGESGQPVIVEFHDNDHVYVRPAEYHDLSGATYAADIYPPKHIIDLVLER